MLQWNGGENRNPKSEQHMCQDKGSLISEAKAEHVSKPKRNLFTASHQQADV